MHGDKSQRQRERALARFERGEVDALVATDVAARGIDVADITHVINYDAPEDRDAYVHRVGRTGRAGRTGTGDQLRPRRPGRRHPPHGRRPRPGPPVRGHPRRPREKRRLAAVADAGTGERPQEQESRMSRGHRAVRWSCSAVRRRGRAQSTREPAPLPDDLGGLRRGDLLPGLQPRSGPARRRWTAAPAEVAPGGPRETAPRRP